MPELNVTIICNGRNYELTADDSETLDVLRIQIMTLTDIDPDDQLIKLFGTETEIPNAPVRLMDVGITSDVMLDVSSASGSGGNGGGSGTGDGAVGTGLCTRALVGDDEAAQPLFVVQGTPYRVCAACANSCTYSSPTALSVSTSPTEAFACECSEAGECSFQEAVDSTEYSAETAMIARDEMSTMAAAVAAQVLGQIRPRLVSTERQLKARYAQALTCVDDTLKGQARGQFPRELIVLARDSADDVPAVVSGLLDWFHDEFFEFVPETPACATCSGPTTYVGTADADQAELAGHPGSVEIYQCVALCDGEGVYTRFPRYNNPGALLQTRRGRLGEAVNLFNVCAAALGLSTRYVTEWSSDLEWIEVHNPATNSWIHVDVADRILNDPLRYERKDRSAPPTYALAYSKFGVDDVTARYTENWPLVRTRRNIVPEQWLATAITALNTAATLPDALPGCTAAEREAAIAAREADAAVCAERIAVQLAAWKSAVPEETSAALQAVAAEANNPLATLDLLYRYLENIASDPSCERFRRIATSNRAFKTRVASVAPALSVLENVAGFKTDPAAPDFLVSQPADEPGADVLRIRVALAAIRAAQSACCA